MNVCKLVTSPLITRVPAQFSSLQFSSVAQSCPTSSPGSFVHWIFQVGILECVAIPFSRGSSWPRDWICVSCIGRRILYHWAPREALSGLIRHQILHAAWKMFFAQSYHWIQLTTHFPFLIPVFAFTIIPIHHYKILKLWSCTKNSLAPPLSVAKGWER